MYYFISSKDTVKHKKRCRDAESNEIIIIKYQDGEQRCVCLYGKNTRGQPFESSRVTSEVKWNEVVSHLKNLPM